MEPRAVVLILILLFLLFGPEQQPLVRFQRDPAAVEARNQQLLGVLRNSSYGDLNAKADRWLNLTGFRDDDEYQWELLPSAQELARDQLQDAADGLTGDLPVYRKPTGELRGRFTRVRDGNKGHQINLTALVPGNDYISSEFMRNVTEVEGELALNLVESKWNSSRAVQEITVRGSISSDSSPGSGWDLNFVGTHCVRTGSIILTTISDKYNAGFALPHFALNVQDYTSTKEVVDEMMTTALDKIKKGEMPSRTTELFPAPSCEYIIWLQERPVQYSGLDSNGTSATIQQIEDELDNPDGAPIGQPPVMRFSGVVFSPDCGYILEAELEGPKKEVFWSLAGRFLTALIIVVALQIALLKRQMEEAATPSTRSRISYQTIAIMAMGDGLLFAAMIGFLIIDNTIFLLVAAAAFVSCLNVALLEVKFLFDLWTVQVGEPAQRERERQATAAPVINTTGDGSVGLPLPVPAPRPVDTGATPVILPPDQDVSAAAADDAAGAAQTMRTPPAASFATLYSRFYFFLVVLMFLSMWALSWPRGLRSWYANTLSFFYLSFWVPQIYRNIIRNCRKALSWEYVIGISILRVGLVVYWNLDEKNILSIDIRPTSAYLLLGYVWLQVAILVSQQFLGPRLFVKDSWCPPAYDYHPILRDDDADTEAGSMLPIGFVASASEAKDKDSKEDSKEDSNRKIFDCAICMNEIDVPVVSKGEGKGVTWLEQRNYMVTPCRHIFHTECLEGWMNLRLVCPICREGLPPL